MSRLKNTLFYPGSKIPAGLFSPGRLQNFSGRFSFLRGWLEHNGRPLGAVVVSLVLLALVFGPATAYYQKIQTMGHMVFEKSWQGFMALRDSVSALRQAEFASAATLTDRAVNEFGGAVNMLQTEHRWLHQLVLAIPGINRLVLARERLLLVGNALSLGQAELLSGVTRDEAEGSWLERWQKLSPHLSSALPHYQTAVRLLDEVSPEALPAEAAEAVAAFRPVLQNAVTDLDKLAAVNQVWPEIVGEKGGRRYLLIFQNPFELRATGGFMGSLGILEVKNGKILSFTIPPGGSYDLQGQLDELVAPPGPLSLVAKRWEFQDANWFPHFPASAQKILWFYRHSRGVTADGVIAINATVLPRLLRLVGPVEDAKRSLTLTPEKGLFNLQNYIETSPEKSTRQPKQVLADLAPEFIARLTSLRSAELPELWRTLEQALLEKEIQLYFTDQASNELVTKLGWGGDLLTTQPGQDYLLAVQTNLQGEKSDADISQSISHQAVVQADGSIIDTVVLRRQHVAVHPAAHYQKDNISYLRLYVPPGSTLIAARGFQSPPENAFRAPVAGAKPDLMLQNFEQEIGLDEQSGTRITEEFGKTAFGNWVVTPVDGISQVQLTYRLPFTIFDWAAGGADAVPDLLPYQLVVQRQAGLESTFESQIVFPADWQLRWSEGVGLKEQTNGALISPFTLEHDTVWSLLVKAR